MVVTQEPFKKYQLLAITLFVASGAVSIYLFFLVTGLPILQGTTDHFLLMVVSLTWVLIFPSWVILYLLAMVLLNKFHLGNNH